MCQNYVGYYRVSTEKQGRSGLGLEAQQTAVEAFIAGRGVDAKLVASFTEVESGKRSDNRSELTRAMEHARLTGATLLIAKLDRLSRDAHFLLGLQKAGVRFVAADMPEANELVVQALKAKADERAAGLASTRHHIRQRLGRCAQRSGLCDASGRPMDGPERSQRHGSAALKPTSCPAPAQAR